MSQNVKKIAPSFGTKVSVSSWIEVKAWKRPITMPTTNVTDKIGSETANAAHRLDRKTSRISFSDMRLDRHPKNFLVRFDHLVANRNGRLDGKLCGG